MAVILKFMFYNEEKGHLYTVKVKDIEEHLIHSKQFSLLHNMAFISAMKKVDWRA